MPALKQINQSPRRTGHSIVFGLGVALGCLGGSWNSLAQNYPTKPVRILVGFIPGGGSDFIARFLAQGLTESFGKTFIVDNRPGAGAAIATDLASKAEPDGYTLLLASAGPMGILPALSEKMNYDPLKDFDPITQVVSMPFVLTVHPMLPAKNMRELILLAKSKPGQLNFGSPGFGTTNHLAGEMLKYLAHINIVHVPYKGVAAAMADVMAGQIQILSGDLTTLIPQVNRQKLRALAVTSAKRSSLAPEIPTIDESGVKGYDTSGWFGMVAPSGTDKKILDQLNQAMVKTLTQSLAKERLKSLGGDVVASSISDFTAFIIRDHAKWAELIKAAHLKQSP